MAISPKILSALQKAGTAVFHADEAVKSLVVDSAQKAAGALALHPMNVQDDDLYQSWQQTVKISKALSIVEAQLKSIYTLAMSASDTSRSTIALPAPAPTRTAAAPLELVNEIELTDVVAKPVGRKLKAAKNSVKVAKVKAGKARAKRSGGQDNTSKVLAYLQTVLNDQSFTKLNQSAVAVSVGLAKGSIGASMKKLLKDGKVVQNDAKEFKLATAA